MAPTARHAVTSTLLAGAVLMMTLLMVTLLAGCSSTQSEPPGAGPNPDTARAEPGADVPDGGDEATWTLAPGQTIEAETRTFTVLVTRSGCNGGVTGAVNDPTIEMTDDTVALTFTVRTRPPGAATCPGNDAVPYEVELPQPLGDRSLKDAPRP